MTPEHHMQEEELLAHYYDDAPSADVERHLASCDGCRAQWEILRRSLAALQVDVPEPDAELEQRIWTGIAPRLRKPRPYVRYLAVGALAAASLIVAFMGGRYSKSVETPQNAGQVRERVLMVALAEHLQQSQMILVELSNADPQRPRLGLENKLAEDLLVSNRLLRQTAVSSGKRGVAGTLEELERVLLEIAHGPTEWSADRLEDVKRQMADEGILFKIRVLNANLENPDRRLY